MRLRRLHLPLGIVLAVLVGFYFGARCGYYYQRHLLLFDLPTGQNIKATLGRVFGFYKRHGQFEQDLWVAFATAPGKKNGFYVDVGSADGSFFSNTELLDQMGWKGICIDPFPTNMQGRTCQIFRQPVFSESGKKVTFRVAGNLGGIESDLGLHSKQAEAAGAVELVTATLDEILAKGHAPNYIDFMSIDIEGAEYDALLGAREMIHRHRPGLAICLYHRPEHLWQIPLLVHSWNLGYRFFLRSHALNGWELVLYSMPANPFTQ